MRPILTVTLNPALDLTTSVDEIFAGPKLRCSSPLADPGGGGTNVSRAIRNLGGTSTAFFAAGGATGQRLTALLAAEGVQSIPMAIDGETRQNLNVTENKSGGQFRFVMPGPKWADSTVTKAIDTITANIDENTIVVVSGSQPPGVPVDFVSMLASKLTKSGVTLIADTSGAPLRQLCEDPCNLFCLRMDSNEAADIAGHPLNSRIETAKFAEKLVNADVAQMVVVARGADGSTLANSDGRYHCARAVSKVVSAVGAGDSFVGGFVLAQSQGESAVESLRHGTAAASAAVLTDATLLCTKADAERLLPECEIVML